MKEEALKLADELEVYPNHKFRNEAVFEASAMIRRLVEELDKYELQTNQNKLQTNQGEPVAWMWQELGRYKWDIGWEKPTNIKLYDSSPLYTKGYTTPQTKPLSDEEILQAVARGWCSDKNSHKTMDSDLAMAIANEIKKAIEERIKK